MSTVDYLLEALKTAVSEKGQNHLQTGKLRQFISLNYPAQKDDAYRIVQGITVSSTKFKASAAYEQKSSGFGSRKPIDMANLNSKNEVKSEQLKDVVTKLADIKESDISAADENVHFVFLDTDNLDDSQIEEISKFTEKDMLATYGRDQLQALSIKLGFVIDVKKNDKNFITFFKKALLKAVK